MDEVANDLRSTAPPPPACRCCCRCCCHCCPVRWIGTRALFQIQVSRDIHLTTIDFSLGRPTRGFIMAVVHCAMVSASFGAVRNCISRKQDIETHLFHHRERAMNGITCKRRVTHCEIVTLKTATHITKNTRSIDQVLFTFD